jgi:hypothetical protein
MGVIREAFKVTQAARDPYDEVWCLVDVDDHESLSEACALATTNGVRVAVSNPAFEIWVLWHYKDQRAAKTRQHLKSALKRFGHEGKNIPSSFPFEAYEDAVRRSFDCAPELLSNQVGNNPSSSFSLIIKAILGA